jgi:hypothetical protein
MDGVLLEIGFGKEYDKVSWEFLQQTLKMKEVDPKWCRWIQEVISRGQGRSQEIIIKGATAQNSAIGGGEGKAQKYLSFTVEKQRRISKFWILWGARPLLVPLSPPLAMVE